MHRATFPFDELNVTVVPPATAGSLRVKVAVGEFGPTIEPGEIWNVLTLGGGRTVIEAVTGAPLAVAVNVTGEALVTENVWIGNVRVV